MLVVDSLSTVLTREAPQSDKEKILIDLYLTSRKGVTVYVYLVKHRQPPELVALVHEIADVVFDLSVERVGERLVYKLSIPKFRGKTSSDLLRYRIEEGVKIDTSRDIA
ncbi:MAG: hypothetical protein ABWW66_01995 [Archaeoglobaceae archaeon]